MADVSKLAKKVAESIKAYQKASLELGKMEKELSMYQSLMSAGNPSVLADTVPKFAKLTAKIAMQHKKILDLQKKMGLANAQMAKAAKGK